jgi:hypothetical protein
MTRGGPRPGSGRPSRIKGRATRGVTIHLHEQEWGEILGALREGETLAEFVRSAALAAARRRPAKSG